MGSTVRPALGTHATSLSSPHLRYLVTRFFLALLCLCAAVQAFAETKYVTDQFEITMRRGESTRYKITRMLPSGSPVEVISSDASTGYSQIRTQDGTVGYVLTNQLLDEPVARDRLATVEAQLRELQQAPDQVAAQLSQLQAEHKQLQGDYQRLETEKNRMEQELATIKAASADVIRVTQERTELRRNVADLTRQVADLQQSNLDLKNQNEQRWFLIGAGVVAGGILLGLILPHLRFRRRKSSWGSL
jgi:SH3 domain protein